MYWNEQYTENENTEKVPEMSSGMTLEHQPWGNREYC